MPVRVYVHLTWTTLQRQPLINAEVAGFLRRFLPKEAQRHGARVLEAGIVADHVHLVLQLLPVINIPRLVQGLKGASARLVNRDGLTPRAPLRWAEGYDLRSVGVRQLRTVIEYVGRQPQRHPEFAIDQRPSGRPTAEWGLQSLITYDGERSTHTMANAPHIRWRTLHTYDGERHRMCGAFAIVCVERSDRKSTRLNSSHRTISYAVFC